MTTTTDFGPLTTIFSAPTGCATEQWVERESSSTLLRWGAGCNGKHVGWDAHCFPSGWTPGNSTKIINKAFNPGYACPSGYTTHANATGTMAAKHYPDYIGSIGTDSLAILCCPTGYDWDGEFCSGNQFQLATRSYLTLDSSKCVTTSAPAYDGVRGLAGVSGGATFQGTPIFLIQKVSATYDIPTSTSTTSPGASSTGLSTGSKIAIGVCVPLGVIIIAVIAFIWWHRRKKAQRAEAAASGQRANQNMDPYTGKPELDAGPAVNPFAKQELDAGNEVRSGNPDAPAELPALETPKTPLAELAAASQSPDTPQAELPGEGTLEGQAPAKENPREMSPVAEAEHILNSAGREVDK